MEKEKYIAEGDQMGLLNVIVLMLFLLWLGAFAFHMAGAFINILLVAAGALFLTRFLRHAV